MRMNVVIEACAFLLMATAIAVSQDNGTPKPDASAREACRYFDRPIDYWRSGGSAKPAPKLEREPHSISGRVEFRENVWAQPIKTPDGSWVVYVPPPAVLDFLESPTEESAKAYLTWKNQQAERLKQAMALLARVRGDSDSGKAEEPKEPTTPGPDPESSRSSFVITYFHQEKCQHCVAQDAVLAQWLRKHPEGKLDLVERGDRPELWKEKQIRGTPTLILSDPASGKSDVLVGLRSLEALNEGLARLRHRPPGASEKKSSTKEKTE